MKTLKNKVIIVTGAGGAIAGCVESAFRKQGAQLVLVDKDGLRIQGRAANYDTSPIEADFSTLAGAQAVVAQVESEMGCVDGLVHLVGEVVTGSLLEATEADYELAFSTNVKTLFNAVQAALPALLKRDEAFVGGIASAGAWQGEAAGAGLFAAAKGAVATLLRSLDQDLAHTPVEVAIVFPMGPVDTHTNRTRFHEQNKVPYIEPFAIGHAFVTAALSGMGGRLLELPVYPPHKVH